MPNEWQQPDAWEPTAIHKLLVVEELQIYVDDILSVITREVGIYNSPTRCKAYERR